MVNSNSLGLFYHDLLDERMGPTYFWPHTHAPRCFPGEIWLPPTASLAQRLPRA